MNTAIGTRPTPATFAAARVPAAFHVQWRDPLGDWQTCNGGAGERLVAPGQDALEALVKALLREHRNNKFTVRATVTCIQAGRPLVAYDTIGPRYVRGR